MEHTKVQFNKNSEERRKKRTKVFLVLLLLFLLVLVGVIAFLRKPGLQITNVQVSGTRALDPQVVARFVDDHISGSYFLVVPKRNTLLFSKRSTREALLTQFPGLEDVRVVFVNRSSIQIEVSERESSHVWCGAQQCYFIDDSGIMYRESPKFSDGVYTFFSGALVELPETREGMIRSRFVTATDYEKLLELYNQLLAYPVEMYEIQVESTRDVTMRIGKIKNYELSHATKLITNLENTPDSLIETMNLLFSDKAFVNAVIAKGPELESIDLRFPGKIFYKFKNATQVDTSDTGTVM